MKEELGVDITGSKRLFAMSDIDPFSGKQFRHNFMLIESYQGKISSSNESEGVMWASYEELTGKRLAPIVRKLAERLRERKLI